MAKGYVGGKSALQIRGGSVLRRKRLPERPVGR